VAREERILNERRRHRDRPFDVSPVSGATMADLDLRRYEGEYLPAAFAPDVLEANGRTLEQRLSSTKMIRSDDDRTPTVVGMLVVGRNPRAFLPGAYVQFLTWDRRGTAECRMAAASATLAMRPSACPR
jgi:ATP-dependent DNA helicase RecG